VKRCLAAGWVLAAACNGPPASDAAVCQDFIHRVCIQPVCSAVTSSLFLTGDCESTLLARTGCSSDAFAFGTPDRSRFLACRLPLLRAGASADSPPNCDDVQDIVNTCPDVVTFLNSLLPDGGR
jgi:hypothetical protein